MNLLVLGLIFKQLVLLYTHFINLCRSCCSVILLVTFNLRGAPVCGATPWPDCRSRTYCYFPLRDTGQTSANCLLATRGQPGKDDDFLNEILYLLRCRLKQLKYKMVHRYGRKARNGPALHADNEAVVYHWSTPVTLANSPGNKQCHALH